MKFPAAPSRRLLCAALLAAAGWAAPACGEPLQPWQMVRSLQLVQDRVADGDRAALPMQRKLLEMIDARLRAVTPEELGEPRNWDAVMIYASAGGNPATVKALMPDLLAVADAAAAKAEAAAKAASGEEEEDASNGHGEEDGHDPAEKPGHGDAGEGHEAEAETHAPPEAAEPNEHEEAEASSHAAPAEAAGTGHGSAEAAGAHGAAGRGPEAEGEALLPSEPVTAGGHDGAEAHAPETGPDSHPAEAAGHGDEAARHDADAHPAPPGAVGHGGEGHPAAHAEAEEASDPVVTHSTESASGHGGEAGHGEAAAGAKDKAGGEHAEAPQDQSRDLALGVYNYGRGRQPDAARALAKVDPMRERPELGAFVALVKGSLAAKDDPAAALKLLDQARLLAPGTLVEEAALRRSIQLATAVEDRGRFLLASGQYVRRFLRSPYASQFADAFVAGVVALNEGLDLQAVAEIAANMAPEQERVVYLRIARQAGIDNLKMLSAFAATEAEAKPEEVAATDPRTALYAALSEVTGEDTGDTLARLDALDESRLTASDRELLAAVKAVAAETLRPPAELPVSAPAAPTNASDIVPATEEAVSEGAVRPEREVPPASKAATAADGSVDVASPEENAVEERMAATRRTLTDVDRLLVEGNK